MAAKNARKRGQLHLGTSGFAYPAWKPGFYPAKLPARSMLAYYATQFSSVEINYTFRTLPSDKTLAAWRDATPEDFVFALKAPMRITHILRLAKAGGAVAQFLRTVAPLGPRTGPILFQCPPNLAFDEARVVAFVKTLPRGLRFAFEFRHPSWTAARDLLESTGAGWCVAETDEETAADDAIDRGPFAYLRLRKSRYAPRELRRWADRIAGALRDGRDVYGYFMHEDTGNGPRYARRLAKLIGDASA
jgi:uncharacterized protein YecE (DUF72 family)